MKTNYIQLYNDQWIKNTISNPLVIMIGGYAGTGKTTLAKKLLSVFKHAIIVNTGVVRAVLCSVFSVKTNPYIHYHTFDLYRNYFSEKEVIRAFEKQCEKVCASLSIVIQFGQSERQILIIDGNHILPGMIIINPNTLVIQFFMYVPNPKDHLKMLGGPTHNRIFSNEQFKTARILHDHIVKKVINNKQMLFTYNTTMDKVMSYINSELERFYSHN